MLKMFATVSLGLLMLGTASAKTRSFEPLPRASAELCGGVGGGVDGEVIRGDDNASQDETAYYAEEQAVAASLRAWMRSLASGLVALFTVALASIGLLRLGSMRRPLAATVLARRPVPATVVLSLLSPVVPPLVLMHAERALLPSPVLLLSAAGAIAALSMLFARRRLAARLRWAAMGPLAGQADGTDVLAEVEPKKLVAPVGVRGRVPWFVADVVVGAGSETARIALAQADVDDAAARLLGRLANGGSVAGEKLTVLGTVGRVPADADAASPLCREAPTMARINRSEHARSVVSFGAPADLLRRLQLECALLAILFGVLASSAALAFLD